MNATCTEEFEKALGKMLNECDAMGLIDKTAPILTDIARHWFDLGFNAAQKTETTTEGYVLVPAQPTAKMIAEFWDEALEIRMIRTSGYSRDAEAILHAAYKAMIAAAPNPGDVA